MSLLPTDMLMKAGSKRPCSLVFTHTILSMGQASGNNTVGVYAPDTFIRLSVTVTVADAGGINVQPQVVVRYILTLKKK